MSCGDPGISATRKTSETFPSPGHRTAEVVGAFLGLHFARPVPEEAVICHGQLSVFPDVTGVGAGHRSFRRQSRPVQIPAYQQQFAAFAAAAAFLRALSATGFTQVAV